MLTIIKFNETEYQVNDQYEYEDQDITAILNARVRLYHFPVNHTPIYPMAAIDTITPGQLTQRLNEDRNNNPSGKRMILIPCNIGNYHWVGVLLEFGEENTCIRAEFLDSAHPKVPQTLQNQLQSFYHVNFVIYHSVIKQNDGTSCGACTIENLILRASREQSIGNISMMKIRAEHLNTLQVDSEDLNQIESDRVSRRRFFESFNRRQRLNERSFNSIPFVFENNETYKSEAEIRAIVSIAKKITQSDEGNFRDKMKEVFISLLGGEKEHRATLDSLRRELWKFSHSLSVQEISEVIFGIKDILSFGTINEYSKETVLQFDYGYLKAIAEFVVDTNKIDEFENKQSQREAMRNHLKDSNDLIREKAAESLKKLSEALKQDELDALRDAISFDTYQTVRIAAAEALYMKGIEQDKKTSKEVVLSLLAYPGFGNPHHEGADLVRERAAKALGLFKDCRLEVMQALDCATKDSFQNVRKAATQVLKELEEQRSILDRQFSSASIQSSHSTARLRLDYLKELLAKEAIALKNEFQEAAPNYKLIRQSFYLFSWRINELNWKYKYKLKHRKLVSEEAWHLFEFICRYLTSNLSVDFSKWKKIADECESLSDIVQNESKGQTMKELSCLSLKKEILPAFARSHLKIIYQQLSQFFGMPDKFDANDNVDCHALLGLLMVVGESVKRLGNINPELPQGVANELNTIKNIRDLLEKKLPGNLFNSPQLLNKVCVRLKVLMRVIEKYFQESPELITIQESDALRQLLELLEEESLYKEQEQAKIFFASLSGDHGQWVQFLIQRDYTSFLRGRFNVGLNDFDDAISEAKRNEVQGLSKQQREDIQALAETHLAGNILLSPFVKLIRSGKTKPSDIEDFLSAKEIILPGIMIILKSQSVKDNVLLTQLSKRCELKNENILQIKKLFDVLNRHDSGDNFNIVLFAKIKELPWLLNLSEAQIRFLRVLSREEAVDNKASLDDLLASNGLNGDEINNIVSSGNRLYVPKNYAKKFFYVQLEYDKIARLIGAIDKLIKLLVEMKKGNSLRSFTQLIANNFKYQLALQISIKAFGILVKEKLEEKEIQQLLAGQTEDLTLKHIRLLELFRDQLAHRASEVDPDQLSWFALQWAIISYPAIKNEVSRQGIQPISIRAHAQSEPEFVISQSMLTEHILLMQDLIKEHGFTRARVFGASLDCAFGIQAELNIIVDSLPETTQIDLYNLEWRIHFMLGYKVQVFTEQSLIRRLSATTPETQLNEIITQSLDLVFLLHLAHIKEMIDSHNWYHVVLMDQAKPIARKDINVQDMDFCKVRTIVSAANPENVLREKQYREKLLQQSDFKKVILEKARCYVSNLLNLVEGIDELSRSVFLERLKATMILHADLDEFYKNNIDLIQSHNLQVSRIKFRELMCLDGAQLPEKIKQSDLAKRAKNNSKKNRLIDKQLRNKNQWNNATLLSMFYFLLDEVKNPGIVELLFDDNTHEGNDLYSQLLNCVYVDFCERFIDPSEGDAMIFFVEPTPDLSEKKAIGRADFSSKRQGVYSMVFYNPIYFNRPVQLNGCEYMRIPFYAEVLRETSILPLLSSVTPIINWGINGHIRNKILNILEGYKPLPESKEMTTNKLFTVKGWQYQHKTQKLYCEATTYEYPPVTDFDSLLEKDKINKEYYPEYEKDKDQFNKFQEVIACLDDIRYYEKYIRNLEQHKIKIESASLGLAKDSQSYEINKEYTEELAARIRLLRNLQGRHIQGLKNSQYIKNYPYSEDFNKRLAEEIVGAIYYDEKDDSSKSQLSNFILDCFNSVVAKPSLFPSKDELIKRRQYSSDLQREYDKQFGLTLIN